jgi:hypothetical protein
MARRHADHWYLIAMNAGPAAKTVTIDPSVLDGFPIGKATLLTDGPDGKTPQQSVPKFDKRGRLTLTIQPQCAAVLY